MKINYEQLTEIAVKSQKEFDMIPADFKGQIYIDFGVWHKQAVVNRSFVRSVIARGNSSVIARESSSVEAWENSSVEARENSSVVAWGNSYVEARENSSVIARENSSVDAWGNSSVIARENSYVEARENSSVIARENSSVVAWGNSYVEAWENSSVDAWENSSVIAQENNSVIARENSSVEANGNAQVINHQYSKGRIRVDGNARIVYMPKTISEFMSFYGIKHDKKKAIFYKAARRVGDHYVSDWNRNFKYQIGETIREECDSDKRNQCSYGIHIAHLAWCLSFGNGWDDLAILEVETDIDRIVMPLMTDGKVRTSEIRVLREVPLEECGVYGKILAKRMAAAKGAQ